MKLERRKRGRKEEFYVFLVWLGWIKEKIQSYIVF
jgi:hypothetical protein